MQSDDCFAREVVRGERRKGAGVGQEASQGSVAREGLDYDEQRGTCDKNCRFEKVFGEGGLQLHLIQKMSKKGCKMGGVEWAGEVQQKADHNSLHLLPLSLSQAPKMR